MSKSKSYNGHKNWNHWNVSLWINNDENLYGLARDFTKYATREEAAKEMLEYLQSMNVYKTPDGAPYSVSSIRAAMVGM